jgi:hypothetical protein
MAYVSTITLKTPRGVILASMKAMVDSQWDAVDAGKLFATSKGFTVTSINNSLTNYTRVILTCEKVTK